MATIINYVTNPGCETNTTGWTNVNGSILSSSADHAWGGTKSQKVVYDGTARAAEQTGTSLASFTFSSSGTHTWSAYVWVPTGMPAVKIKIGGPYYNVSGTVSTLNDQWERLYVTTSVNSGLPGWLYLLNNTTSVANATGFYADGAMENVGALIAYFDGDTTDTGSVLYDWLGGSAPAVSIAQDIVSGAIVWDPFNRVNNGSVLGSPNTGPAPTILAGTWGISGLQAYAPSIPGGGAQAVWECSTTNVDITVRRTSSINQGGIFFGVVSTTEGWYAYFNGDTAGGSESYLAKFVGTSVESILKGRAGTIITTATTLRLIHYNGWVEMWADSTLVLRGLLPETITATKHGIRASSGSQTFEDLVIMAAPDITVAVKTGDVRGYEFGSGDSPPRSSFVYRGRDTKDQDVTGVS